MGRKRGRPKDSDRPITPEALEDIGFMHLTGRSMAFIARKYGVAFSTIKDHIDRNIKPKWEAELGSTVQMEVAKVNALERVAWHMFRESRVPQTSQQVKKALTDGGSDLKVVERVLKRTKRTGEAVWLDIVRWCMDYRAKIAGHYKSDELVHGRSPVIVRVLVENKEQADKVFRYEEAQKLLAEANN